MVAQVPCIKWHDAVGPLLTQVPHPWIQPTVDTDCSIRKDDQQQMEPLLVNGEGVMTTWV